MNSFVAYGSAPLSRHAWFVVFFLAMVTVGAPSWAAITNKGTEFWLTFPQGNGGTGGTPVTLQLLITSATGASGQVAIPGLSFAASFTVAAGATTQVLIPAGAQATMTDGISPLGIHVTSDHQVSVNGLNYVQYASDGYTGLPVEALGTDYMVVSYKNESLGTARLPGSEFAVVGTQDCTHVTITPPHHDGPPSPGGPLHGDLEPGGRVPVPGPVGRVGGGPDRDPPQFGQAGGGLRCPHL